MPTYRFTIDTDASDPLKARLNIQLGGGNTIACDELTEHDPTPRAVIFRRRATISTDSAGDFLPSTQPCALDDECKEIALVLVSWSDGLETPSCGLHAREHLDEAIDRNELRDYMQRGVE